MGWAGEGAGRPPRAPLAPRWCHMAIFPPPDPPKPPFSVEIRSPAQYARSSSALQQECASVTTAGTCAAVDCSCSMFTYPVTVHVQCSPIQGTAQWNEMLLELGSSLGVTDAGRR